MRLNSRTLSAAARVIAPVFCALMLVASPGRAASVSYILDQSNTLADGVPYLQVTVADGADGAIDFTVEILDSLSHSAGQNFGIQAFAFNVIAGGDAEAANVGNLPEGWITRDHYRMSEFGFFDIKLYGGGNSRLQTLTFSILGIDGDTPEDYAVLSTGNVPNDNSFFAAHVADFKFADCTSAKKCPSSAFFAGSSAVPLPGAAWLFATGVAGVMLRARKRKAAALMASDRG